MAFKNLKWDLRMLGVGTGNNRGGFLNRGWSVVGYYYTLWRWWCVSRSEPGVGVSDNLKPTTPGTTTRTCLRLPFKIMSYF
jgi:hypothetical protein